MDHKKLFEIFEQKDLSSLSPKEIEEVYSLLNEFNSYIYNFVLTYYKYMYTPREYVPNGSLSMMEVHLITHISQQPGIYASTLAEKWDCTPAYISRILKGLEQKGYIYRKANNNNHRFFHLYVTEKGQAMDLAHKKYDILSIVKTNSLLLQKFSLDDLINLRNMLEEYGKHIDSLTPAADGKL